MSIKGMKFKTYTLETKLEAIRLHVEEKWTYRQITEKLEIHVKDRVKRWMRKYKGVAPYAANGDTIGHSWGLSDLRALFFALKQEYRAGA